jgi:hypothetical protein
MDNWREPYDAKVSRTVLTGGMRKQALALRLVPTHSERCDCAACTGAGEAAVGTVP